MKEKQVTISASYGFTRGASDNGRSSAPFVEVWSPAPTPQCVADYLNDNSDKEITLTAAGFDVRLSEGVTVNYRVDGTSAEEWLKEHGVSGITERNVERFPGEVVEWCATELSDTGLTSKMEKANMLALLVELNSTYTQHIVLTTTGFETHGPYGKRVFGVKGVVARNWVMHAIWAVGTYNACQPATDKTERVEKGNDEKEETKINAAYVIKQLTTSVLRDEWRVISEEEASLWIAKSDNAFATLVNRFLTVTSDQNTRRRFKIEGGDPVAWVKENCAVHYEVTSAS